jgi:hypothetical protein
MANLNVLTKVSKDATLYTILAPASLVAGNAVELLTRNASSTFNVQEPTDITALDVAIAIPVTLPYGVETEENDFVIATGADVRVVIPYKGMMVDFPVANVTATVAVAENAYVIIDAGAYKMECVASLGGTESVAFQIARTYTLAGVAMFSMRCIKSL